MSHLFIGLISGTSADGIDAALVEFPGANATEGLRLHAARVHAWAPALRERLVALGQGGEPASLDELGRLDVQVAQAFATAALALLEDAGVASARVAAIGSHGQTARHRPHGDAPFTMQLGDGSVIAERTGIATVADFRRRDVAAGGQGAPLVPAFHAALLHAPHEDRAVLNLGGIGNYTLLPRTGQVRGFDTGPANALLDAWCLRHTGAAYDADGAFAASGTVDDALLARLLGEPWFAQPPPKSTGREQFHLDWVQAGLRGGESPADVQATLLELSAATLADALRAHQPGTARVLACGGGVRNGPLMRRIAARLPGVAVESTAAHGLDPDFVEAMAFAWLAREALAGRPGNLPAVTGARGPRVLGVVHPA
ncbi:anhydro-N-acetylmuramic acid kinase [Pseudoxanthomonas broegbernensis]|uniref:Anhydro-N-acetylmuramic acid kinase n=1 Tax=Pseudoxanthomonas broegbernensis TaxID=83619 RepID=A0A7V8K7F0_9GAMM|nr:anhydro-N-acetylmuramic acid kinase [Pseudoxanthomonas broegbernensis]KAF1687065.1 anhydro-N-acetylmuramic acid kinase [Pseudoxanthomonas broegbernensis]MBB6065350.1 anhydro-N-acetylmuramic acid kinase [Pseudoxanthomonas broegbernensis]